MLFLFLDAVILYFLTTRFGDYSDTSSQWKTVAIVIAAVIVQVSIRMNYPGDGAYLAAVLLEAGTVALLLVFWCRNSWTSSLKIAAIFLGVRIAYGTLIEALQA